MILITGGAGYIGSHCATKLLEENKDIVIFDNLSTGHNETIDVLNGIKSFKFIKGDLLNFEEIDSVFKNNKIDSVIHFAAFSQVGESVVNPQKYYFNNVFGSLNLFKAMIENDIKKIVFSSTASVYGEPKYVPIDENHPLQPINPYGKTKLMIENILDDYDKAYGLKSVRLRYFNVAGADSKNRVGEWHENETHLIPNILKSTLKESEKFKMFGDDYDTKDGTCVRDYINVEDLACAHLLALDYLNNNNKTNYFNLGTNSGNTVKEVFSTCEKVTNQKIDCEICPKREGDPAILIADNSKAKEILKWNPKKELIDSIKTAYLWEKKLSKGKING